MQRKPIWLAGSARGSYVGGFRLAAIAALLLSGCASDAQRADAGAGESADPAQPGQGPNATETNFFTIPCDEDADCADGLRCVQPPDTVDGGAPLPRCME